MKIIRLRTPASIAILALLIVSLLGSMSSPAQALSGSFGIHDPSVIQVGSCYYAFGTGTWLPILKSCTSMYGPWAFLKNTFSSLPSWIPGAIGATPSNLWAPDVNFVNGQYRMYYAGSSFGTNKSVIGLATASNIEGPWTDAGEVFRSVSSDTYNAIDPDYIEGKLSFGSFWSGIKMIDIGADGKRSGTALYSLATRGGGTCAAGSACAIEASSIVHNGSFYYLFVSFDKCCAGVNSTYRTMMGRSSSLTGPYTDQNGTAMLSGGGTQLLATNGNEIGPGGGDVSSLPGYYAYHFYDGAANGASKLQIRPITYSNGWPVLGAPIASGCCSQNPTPTRTNTPTGPIPTPTRTPTPGASTNLALGKTASADSSQAANPAASGNDGSTTTRWCAADGNLNHWWKVDLGASHTLTGSEVMWEKSGLVYKYKVEVSTDNTNWTLVIDKTNNTSTSQTQTDNFTATARYVRITVTGLSTSPVAWASFFEFRVFGN